jgi:hypothetical protein
VQTRRPCWFAVINPGKSNGHKEKWRLKILSGTVGEGRVEALLSNFTGQHPEGDYQDPTPGNNVAAIRVQLLPGTGGLPAPASIDPSASPSPSPSSVSASQSPASATPTEPPLSASSSSAALDNTMWWWTAAAVLALLAALVVSLMLRHRRRAVTASSNMEQ